MRKDGTIDLVKNVPCGTKEVYDETIYSTSKNDRAPFCKP